MRFTVATEIACPPEQAFRAMGDARNEVDWNAQVSAAELVYGEPPAAGSSFRVVNRGNRYEATITQSDEPRTLVYAVTGKQMDIGASFGFAPSGGGTRITGTFELRPKGVFKLMTPVLRLLVPRDLQKQSQGFKEYCERRRTAEAQPVATP